MRKTSEEKSLLSLPVVFSTVWSEMNESIADIKMYIVGNTSKMENRFPIVKVNQLDSLMVKKTREFQEEEKRKGSYRGKVHDLMKRSPARCAIPEDSNCYAVSLLPLQGKCRACCKSYAGAYDGRGSQIAHGYIRHMHRASDALAYPMP